MSRRDQAWKMRRAWIEKLHDYILTNDFISSDSTVLDYGCGYFDLGFLLQDDVRRVDGFEPDPATFEVARRDSRSSVKSTLYSEVSQIPENNYDLIVLNSVVQYMGTERDFVRFLENAKRLLKEGKTSNIILSDLIPPDYSSARDAVRSLSVSSRGGFLLPMVLHLLMSVMRSAGAAWYRISREDVVRITREAELRCKILPDNLTPSRSRFSCTITKQPGHPQL